MTVTLAKLLKQKNLLVAEINELKTRIQRENRTEGENKSKYDLKAEYQKLNDTIEQLVKVKTAISTHNVTVVDKIYRMSELKAQITALRQIDTSEGTFRRASYGGEPLTDVFTVQFDKLFVDEQIAKLTTQINDLQDELDTHNHVTKISL